MNMQNNSNSRRQVTTVWSEAEVAKRALELFDLENAAREARRHMIDRAMDFKEKHGIDHVNLNDPKLRRYTAKALAAVIAAKGEIKKARARLLTACRRCPRINAPRVKTQTPRMSRRTLSRLFGE
ncbi:hypothetical protein PQR14_26900 [Paraburkholderia bryophila]|uniref:hypothetical protein n=1 Tax=Paraburkholderia bryophila TaxID=420952 RepID=UPI0038B7E351